MNDKITLRVCYLDGEGRWQPVERILPVEFEIQEDGSVISKLERDFGIKPVFLETLTHNVDMLKAVTQSGI